MSDPRVGHDLLRRALGDHLAAVLAGARADVDDVVGRAHRLLVVLDHDHGVAEVAQAHQRVDQAVVVALVQADAGLVEDVEHARPAPEPIWVARRMRCASPPESVAVARSSVR